MREYLRVLGFTYTCQLDVCHVVGRKLLSLDWIEIESVDCIRCLGQVVAYYLLLPLWSPLLFFLFFLTQKK